MGLFSDLTQNIITVLAKNPKLNKVVFSKSLTSIARPNPVNKTYITVGVANVSIESGSFCDYLGFRKGNEFYGKLVKSDVAISIYVPQKLGGEICYDIFSDVYDSLFNSDVELNVKSISCEKVVYNEELFSFVLSANIKIESFIGYETDDTEISGITVIKS